MAICLEQGADLHMAQLMPLPLTVSCFSKIQIGFTFLVPAHPGSPGKGTVKRVCAFVCDDRKSHLASIKCKQPLGWPGLCTRPGWKRLQRSPRPIS